jgi:hypothetical protein
MFAAPIFYFLGVILFIFAVLAMLGAVAKHPSYIVLSCLLFVFGYNSFLIGTKIRTSSK